MPGGQAARRAAERRSEMKVGEVREKLKEYDQAELIEMFVAADKLLPKYVKE